jgi:DNA polymerase III epsilon subunit-like protein
MIPDNYLVFDTETSGFGSDDWVLQYGYYQRMEDGNAVSGEITLNVPESVSVSSEAEAVHGITRAVMQERGIDPEVGTKAIRDLLQAAMDSKMCLVAHNMQFDVRLIGQMFTKFNLPSLCIHLYDKILDTGLLYKAKKAGVRRRPGEKIWDFYTRVGSLRIKGLKWGIDVLIDEFKLGLEKRGNHDAGEDCRITGQLVEYYRKQTWVDDVLAGK